MPKHPDSRVLKWRVLLRELHGLMTRAVPHAPVCRESFLARASQPVRQVVQYATSLSEMVRAERAAVTFEALWRYLSPIRNLGEMPLPTA